MHDILDIRNSRREFVASIYSWWSRKDLLFCTTPRDISAGHPSFTNSAIVAEAFSMSGELFSGQTICKSMREMYCDNLWTTYPSEAMGPQADSTHIMCNYWVLRAFSRVTPIYLSDCDKLYHWICNLQLDNGRGWPLAPGLMDDYPLCSAVALSALLTYHTGRPQDFSTELAGKIDKAIKSAVEYLLGIAIQGKEPQLLWAVNAKGARTPSFFTTAFALDALSVYALRYNDERVRAIATASLLNVLKNVDVEVDKFFDTHCWDHLSHAQKLQYYFSSFPPFYLTFFVEHYDRHDLPYPVELNQYASQSIAWLMNNRIPHGANIGLPGNNDHRDVRVWSTAQGVLSLTTALSRFAELTYTSNAIMILQTIEGLRESVTKYEPASTTVKVCRFSAIIIFATLFYFAYTIYIDRITDDWNFFKARKEFVGFGLWLLTFFGLKIPQLKVCIVIILKFLNKVVCLLRAFYAYNSTY